VSGANESEKRLASVTKIDANSWAPTNLSVQAVNGKVRLTWIDVSPYEQNFIVDRRIAGGTWETAIATLPAGTTTYNDPTDDILNNNYEYQIYASFGTNESAKTTNSISKLAANSWAPTLTAQNENGKVKLTWNDNCTFEEFYKIDRRTNDGTWEIAIATLNAGATFYSDATTDLLANTYEYRVYAVTGSTESAKSEKAIAKIDANSWAPADLTASIENGYVNLTWKDVSTYEQNFKIDRRIANGTWETGTATLPAGTTTYIDKNIDILGNSYEYRVYASAGTNESLTRIANVTKIDASAWSPSNLTAQIVNRKVKLTWEDISMYEENFKVDRRVNNGTWELAIATLPAGTRAYTDAISDILANSYEYSVYAVAKINESETRFVSINKIEASAWAPTNLTAIIENKKVRLTWNDISTYEENFKIDRRIHSGTWETAIATLPAGTSMFYDPTADILNQSYDYQVYGVTGTNESAKAIKTISQLDANSWAPTLTAQNENGKVKLTWIDNCTFEEYYKIDRRINNGIWEIAIATINTGATTYTDATSDLLDNTYEYRVYAVVGTSESAKAEIKIIKIDPLEMVLIKSGTFQMGSPVSELGRNTNETQHTVTLSSFYICKYEVMYKLWYEIMRTSPYNSDCDGCPVVGVSWIDIQSFLAKLNEKYPGNNFRLPTEAEWEYAARAGSKTPFNTGNCLSTTQANYNGDEPYQSCAKGEYREKMTLVGRFPPNAYGLYDMHGNVLEWCSDWYNTYTSESQTNPTGPTTGMYHVLRSGSWGSAAIDCRSAKRNYNVAEALNMYIGFRLARSVSQ